ncbi:MAG TPA: hypothetical protein VGC65_07655, partial [Bacteroidia bacterium]
IPGKTAVFKVRSVASSCIITCKEPQFLLEINNPVVIKVKGRNQKIVVVVTDGKVMSVEGDTYFIRFTRPGQGLISVYQDTPTGRKLLATKSQVIKPPQVVFCGIKMDSTSKSIKLRGTNFYAYSDYYKQAMPVVSFEMYFVDDTTAKKIVPITLKSDSCMISAEMRKKILNFQPRFNYMYFNNIILGVPDGSKRILDPIELRVVVDTADKEKLSLRYFVMKKKF